MLFNIRQIGVHLALLFSEMPLLLFVLTGSHWCTLASVSCENDHSNISDDPVASACIWNCASYLLEEERELPSSGVTPR